MKVADIVRVLETLAPTHLAEAWDNVGLLVGDSDAPVRKVLTCMDVTEAIVAEAVAARAQMILAHHPAIFKPIGRVTAGSVPAVYEAIRRGVAIYAAHTNFDNVVGGTNDVLADALDLVGRRPIQPLVRAGQCKVVVFTPPEDLSRVANAAFDAGAGRIGNYQDCAFFGHGVGSFLGGPASHPKVGRAGRHEAVEELRLEIICPREKVAAVCQAVRGMHSYEEPALDVYPLEDVPSGCGGGRIGTLAKPATVATIVARLKKVLRLGKVSLAVPAGRGKAKPDGKGRLIKTVAVFCGSGGSGWRDALAGGADVYVTGEMGYHDAQDAIAHGLTVLCLGHGNSERSAIHDLGRRLAAALPKLAHVPSAKDRDPYNVA